MKLGTIAYVPPPGVGNSDAFMKNLRNNPTLYPLHLYSDYEWKDVGWTIADPAVTKTPQAPWAISNCVWLFGLKLAAELGLDYFLYLEADCRVRNDPKPFDAVVFSEFFDGGRTDRVVGGSPVLYFPSESGRDVLKSATEFCHDHLVYTGRPVPIYGTMPGRAHPLCLYPNGAAAVYHTKTLLECFSGFLPDLGRYSQRITAWDVVVGQELYKKFRGDVFKKVAPLKSVLSAYGDAIYSNTERMHLLLSGQISVVHQIKSAWDGTEQTKRKYETPQQHQDQNRKRNPDPGHSRNPGPATEVPAPTSGSRG